MNKPFIVFIKLIPCEKKLHFYLKSNVIERQHSTLNISLCVEHMLHATPPLKLIHTDSASTCSYIHTAACSADTTANAVSMKWRVVSIHCALDSHSLLLFLSKDNYNFLLTAKQTMQYRHTTATKAIQTTSYYALTISAFFLWFDALCWLVTWSVYLLIHKFMYFAWFSNYDCIATARRRQRKFCMRKCVKESVLSCKKKDPNYYWSMLGCSNVDYSVGVFLPYGVPVCVLIRFCVE